MQQAKPHADVLGSVIGMLILLAGIGMLAYAFHTAYILFKSPLLGFEFLGSKSASTPAPINIGAAALEFVKDLVYLGFMTAIGSIASGKGIALYLGAIQFGEPKHPRGEAAPATSTTPSTPAPSTPTSTEAKPATNPQKG